MSSLFDALLDAHKRENSPVPLPPKHQQPRTTAESLESRVARGDYAAIAATLKGLTTALESWPRTLQALPDVPMGAPEGAALIGVKANVVPELERLAALAKALTKDL